MGYIFDDNNMHETDIEFLKELSKRIKESLNEEKNFSESFKQVAEVKSEVDMKSFQNNQSSDLFLNNFYADFSKYSVIDIILNKVKFSADNVKFRNGTFGKVTKFLRENEITGEVKEIPCIICPNGYWFTPYDFEENGKCKFSLTDATDWDIIAIYSYTICPPKVNDPQYRTILWEEPKEPKEVPFKTYTYDELKEILGVDFKIE